MQGRRATGGEKERETRRGADAEETQGDGFEEVKVVGHLRLRG